MTEHDENHFDDPALKEAVRRTVGRETAPTSLRAKVLTLMAAEAAADAGAGHDNSGGSSPPSSSSSTPSRRAGRRLVIDRNVWRTSAVAAFVLIAIGFAAYQVREHLFPSSPYPLQATATVIPATLVQDMVKRHDACAKLPDHHLIAGDNPEALREKLTAQGGVTASATTLSGGWNFRGAGICKVGERNAAHLLFVREEQYVSIFSMPAPEGCGYGTQSYEQTVDTRRVAGFTRGDGLYCVVGSCDKGEFTSAQLDEVLKQVQASVAVGCMTHETLAAAAAAEHAHPHP